MFKNKEVKSLFLAESIIFIIGIIILIIINNYSYINYKKELINNNAFIINNIIKKHPELEKDIIGSLSNKKINYNESIDILKKYDLASLENLDYINNNVNLRNNTFIYNLVYIIILMFIIFTLFIIFISKTYKRIKDLSNYTSDILNNNYKMDIKDYEEGDISNLKNDLYKMTIKLKEQNEISLNDKKYLSSTLSDISHQLKTPLTSMYVINEILGDDNVSSSKKKELLSKNKSQLERIEWLISSLLKMSRLDSDSEVLRRETCSLRQIIDKSLEPLIIPLELKNIGVSIECDNNIKPSLDFNWTCEALINIIKNACEHTKVDGSINIICSENPIYYSILIKDNGTGISKEDLPHIFERFYRGKNTKESIGIGLNMAKKIVDKQFGDIFVTSSSYGTTFEIKFYKNAI